MGVPGGQTPRFTTGPQEQTAFVAVFDTLGFKDRLRKEGLTTINLAYQRLKRHIGACQNLLVTNGKGFSVEQVGYALVSDTIFLWCNDDWESVQTLVTVSTSLLASCLEIDWPVRGGIAYGRCIIDVKNLIFLGQPIVDAVAVERGQNWIGAALHESVINHSALGKSIIKLEDVIEYDVPMKPGCASLKYALHWCQYSSGTNRDLTTLLNSAPTVSAKEKSLNTRSYVQTCCQGSHADD